MKVLELNSVSKEDSFLYYRNKYCAIAVLEVLSHQISFPLSFTVEVSPLGERTVELEELPKTLDYPVLPITLALKRHIIELAKEGKLP